MTHRQPFVPRPLPQNAWHRIELVFSPLANMQGLLGYHSSVLVDGEEYYFSPSGIRCYPKLSSHRRMSVERVDVGESVLGGATLLDVLSKHFQPRTYDLLRKNCNNFTDCGVMLLMGKRLESRLRSVETMGIAAERLMLVQILSGGRYKPNEQASNYDHEAVIAALTEQRRQLLPTCEVAEEPCGQPLEGLGGQLLSM